jgi:hypothetical protein
MTEKKKSSRENHLFTTCAIFVLLLPFVFIIVYSLISSAQQKRVDPIDIDETYERIFKGRTATAENSASGTYTSGMTYRVDDTLKTACVSKTGATDSAITIPYYYNDGTNNYTVTAIDYSGFANCPNLTSVTFQTVNSVSGAKNITLMDSQCFACCPNLTTFNSAITGHAKIPSNVSVIHSASFMNDQSITGLVIDKVANKLISIEDNAFNGCIGINESLQLNKIVNSTDSSFEHKLTIGASAFANCINLPQALMPLGVSSIGEGAFYNCKAMKIVAIPSTCTSIGTDAFRLCSSATAYIGSAYRYQSGWPNNTTNPHAFDSNDANSDYTPNQKGAGTCLYGDWNYASYKKAIPIIVGKDDISISADSNYIYSTTPISITVNSVTKTLFKITIVQYIGTDNSTIAIPASWEIDTGAYTSWLEDSDGAGVGVVTEIASNAFNDTALTSIAMPVTLETINSNAFNGCTNISSLIFVDNYVAASDEFSNTFSSYVDGVQTDVRVGSNKSLSTSYNSFGLTGLTTISDYAFTNSCSKLTSLVIPHSVVTIGNYAFGNANTKASNLPLLQSLTFNMYSDHSASLERIGNYAFCKIGTDVASSYYGTCQLVLPKDMTGSSSYQYLIGTYAFYSSPILKTIVMGNLLPSTTTTTGLTYNAVKEYAFSDCNYLRWAYFGNGVYRVNDYSLSSCASLEWVYLSGTAKQTASVSSKFSYYNYNIAIYVGWSGTNPNPGNDPTMQRVFSNGNGVDARVMYMSDKIKTYTISFQWITFYYNISGMKGITQSSSYGANYIYTYDGNLESSNLGVQAYYPSSASSWTITKGLKYSGVTAINLSSLTGIQYIGYRSFYLFSTLQSIILPNTIIAIGEFAFAKCTSLTSIGISGAATTLPSTLTSVDRCAFAFSGLTSVTLDPALTKLGFIKDTDTNNFVCYFDAFLGCTSITDINMNSASGYNTTSTIFCDNSSTIGAIYKKNGSDIALSLVTGSSGSYTVYSGTTSITQYAFIGSKLTGVVIPDSVTTISDNAFHVFSADPGYKDDSVTISADSCTPFLASALTSISLASATSSNITYIGLNAFAYQTALTSIELPNKANTLVTLKGQAFYCCTSLTSITFPSSTASYIDDDGVVSDGYYKLASGEFYHCYRLTTVTIPNSINYLGDSLFQACANLTTVNWATSIKYIGTSCFDSCKKLSAISAFPSTLVTIGASAFNNCYALSAVNFTNATSLTSLGDYAFSNCTSLTSLSMSGCSSLTSIGTGAFQYCNSITTADLTGCSNAGLTSTGDSVFIGCVKLKTVSLPTNITSIGSSAFSGNTVLDTISGVENVTTIGSSAFQSCVALTSLTGFAKLVTISSSAFLSCSNLVTFFLVSTVQTIGASAFENCAKLLNNAAGGTQFVLPDAVSSLGTSAFKGCSALTYVKCGTGITSIPDTCFQNNAALVSFLFNASSITSIGTSAFNGCTSLLNTTGSGNIFTIPNSVTSIGETAFNGDTSLVNIKIGTTASGSSLTSLGASSFAGCTSLVQIVFNTGTSFTSIGASAFNGCSALTNTGTSKLSSGAACFAIPSSVTNIGNYAFQNCNAMRNVFVPSSVTTSRSQSIQQQFCFQHSYDLRG